MQVVNIADTGVFRAIGKPPNPRFEALRDSITTHQEAVLQLPRPIYRELGGDPDAGPAPTGSDYVDTGLREGWIKVADPIEDDPPMTEAMRDAQRVMQNEIAHPKTAVLDEDLSLIGLAIQLFDRAESIHINLFTTDEPLRKAAVAVIQYYGYYDCDIYYAPPQQIYPDLIQSENFTTQYRSGI